MRCFSFIFESQSLHSACLLRGECGQMGNDQMHARQRIPLEVKGDRCQAHGSWGSLRTRAGSECSGEGRTRRRTEQSPGSQHGSL